MAEYHSWYNGSVWHIHKPYQVYVGQWPIFYGPAILLHILKTYLMEKRCTWDNGSLWLKDRPCKIYVGQWPIFHGPLILPYIIVRLKLFLYIKKWHRPGVFVPLWALALVSKSCSFSPETPNFGIKIRIFLRFTPPLCKIPYIFAPPFSKACIWACNMKAPFNHR